MRERERQMSWQNVYNHTPVLELLQLYNLRVCQNCTLIRHNFITILSNSLSAISNWYQAGVGLLKRIWTFESVVCVFQ